MRFELIHRGGFAALVFATLSCSLVAQVESGYNFRLDEPIPVKNQNGQDLLLVGMQGNLVSFSFASMPDAEASIPVEEDPQLRFIFEYPDNFADIQSNVLNGNYERALLQIRNPPIELLRFLVVPEEKCNFHLYTEIYYRSLVHAGTPEVALQATRAIPWKSKNVPPSFVDHANTLLNRMVASGEVSTTSELLDILQTNLPIKQFSSIALPIADQLRLIGKNEIAENIYTALSQSSDPEVRKLGQMWTAYNLANTGRVDEAKKLFEQIGEVTQESPLFAVFCLAQGRLALSEENTTQALRFLARAMVRTTIADSYKPEIYFLMIKSYMIDGNIVPATRLAKEMAVFYPTNMWRESVIESYPEITEKTLEL